MNRVLPTLTLCGALVTAALSGCTTTAPATPPAAPAAPVTPAAAANMANNCFACHGPNGRSPGAIPSLHNASAASIADALKAFKNGTRPSTVMGRHAKGYSDAEIEAVAKHIGNLNARN